MNDVVLVAVVEGAGNLTTEFTCLLFLKLAMGDNIVKHLSAIYIFEEHVPMVVGPDDVP